MRALVVLTVVAFLAVPLVQALPTPGVNGETFEPVTGRIFPEPMQTNDYVSYDEARTGLAVLEERHPDRLEVLEIGESAGWVPLGGSDREPLPVLTVEVTDETSDVPFEAKRKSVFFLSIHGNEKGGREGGLRAIEDLAAGTGIAAEEPELLDRLRTQVLVFVFANTDGWTHEEARYRHNDACYTSATCDYGEEPSGPGAETQNFVRVNAHGVDLNRQFPTMGFLDDSYSHRTLSEPESQAMYHYLGNLTNVAAGVDIHGMLTHDNYFLIMIKDGKKDQRHLFANEDLAERLKQRINANPYYATWTMSPHVDDTWGGEGQFAEWASTIDAIGYSASGSAGAFIVQDLGLDAPGFTVEMSYNHITFDNYYPVGAHFNDYHVRAVRDTVITFMEFASEGPKLTVDASGVRAAWLATDVVATNADDDPTAYDGWFTETDADDRIDISHTAFTASLNDWFTDLAPWLANGALDRYGDAGALAGALGGYDTVVIPGSAATKVADRSDVVAALSAWTQAGGNLVLTDEALALLSPLGLVDANAVGTMDAYAGHTDLATTDHALLDGVRGAPRQTYDPNPLGYAPDSSPVWYVDEDAWPGAAIGTVQTGDGGGGGPLGMLMGPASAPRGVNLGTLAVGDGEVRIFGAVLPDPTEETYHPYGLDGYAPSTLGNVVLLNLLGFDAQYATEVISLEDLLPADVDEVLDEAGGFPVPAPLALVALLPAAFLRRRR